MTTRVPVNVGNPHGGLCFTECESAPPFGWWNGGLFIVSNFETTLNRETEVFFEFPRDSRKPIKIHGNVIFFHGELVRFVHSRRFGRFSKLVLFLRPFDESPVQPAKVVKKRGTARGTKTCQIAALGPGNRCEFASFRQIPPFRQIPQKAPSLYLLIKRNYYRST